MKVTTTNLKNGKDSIVNLVFPTIKTDNVRKNIMLTSFKGNKRTVVELTAYDVETLKHHINELLS